VDEWVQRPAGFDLELRVFTAAETNRVACLDAQDGIIQRLPSAVRTNR